MNQHADTAISGGTWMATLSSLAGVVTLDRVYMITAVAGLVIAIFGYLDKKRTEKLKRQDIEEDMRIKRARLEMDRERNQAAIDALKNRTDTPAIQKYPDVAEGVNDVLQKHKEGE